MSEFVEIDPSGRYGRLGKVLGRGAMKTVYQAFDEALGMEVAWNQVLLHDIFQSPDELQRLYTEVHLLKNLKHDAIVQFYTSWIDSDHRTFNFITEMFTSGTLRDYRKRYKQVDMRAIKNWARQILRGLLYLHSHDPPVIHRDLKCDNILVNGHLGIVKIGDLGLAAILRSSQHAHSVIGTPEFMAPELYEEEYNELVDVYSFGMCMLEMLTLELPYSECSNTAQIYKKVTAGKKPNAFYRIQDLEAQSFVGKCLQVASKRLSAHELLLDPFLASDELFLASEPPLQMCFPKAKRHLPPVEPIRSNDMTITGKVNPEDNTIDLKVQIADSNGHARNILFPFDIENDTAMNVAIEMVKELDICDRDPFEIAEMIEEEISALVPDWKDRNLRRSHPTPQSINHQSFSHEDGDQGYDDANNSEKCTFSSISFLSGDSAGSPSWLPSDSPGREDRRLWGSYGFSNCSEFDCTRINENQSDSDHERGERTSPIEKVRLMRFCPAGKAMQNLYHQEPNSQCDKMDEFQSFKDVRSQHLHQALRQSLDRHKLKTVGAVENIGFRVPCAVSEQCASSKSIS